MSQQFVTTDVLRLEVEDDPTGLVNLVQNPNGELGGWGWVTPVAGTTVESEFWNGENNLVFRNGTATVGVYFTTEDLPVVAGEYAAARFDLRAISASHNVKVQFEWLDSSKVVLSSSAQSGALSAIQPHNYGPLVAPANTAYVRLRFDFYNGVSGPSANSWVYFNEATVSKAVTAAELGSYRANLIPNPSFEVDAKGWESIKDQTASPTASLARSTAQAFSGSASLAVTSLVDGYMGATTAETLNGWDVSHKGIPIAGGANYTASVYTRPDTTARLVNLLMNWYSDSGEYLGKTSIKKATNVVGAWTRISHTATAPSGAAYAAVVVAFGAQTTGTDPVAGEVHYIDAVMLEKASTVGTYFDSTTPDAGGVDYASATHPTSVTTRTNLVTNPSFETNTTGWVAGGNSAIARSSTVGGQTGSWALRVTASVGTGTISTRGLTGENPLTAGETYTVSAYTRAGSVARGVRMGLAVFNSAGTLLTTFVPSAVTNSTSAWKRVNFMVSADTIFASQPTAAYVAAAVMVDVAAVGEFHYFDAVLLERTSSLGTYFDGATPDGTLDFGTVDRAWTGTAHNSTSTETTTSTMPYSTATSSNLAYIEPVPYLNVLGPTHELKVNREALNIGTLTATILDSSLDPASSDLIRPGRRVRLTANDGSAWVPLFTGKATEASVTYALKDPNVPESRRARIVLTAVDTTSTVANQQRNEGVSAIDDLPYVLEGCGVPWNVNGSGNQVPTATVVAYNDNASALDQIAVTRDSNLGYAWVDRYGTVQVWDAAQVPMVGGVLDDALVTDYDVSYNTGDCINEVMIKFLRLNPTTGDTEEVPHGPYRNETSIAEWGVRSAEFTVQGISEETANLAAFAQSILDANSTPVVRVNGVTCAVRTTDHLDTSTLLADLMDYPQVVKAAVAPTFADPAFIQTIEHSITPEKWIVKFGFLSNGVVPSPTQVPSPSPGAGGLTIGQLLRPVGEMTMFYGSTPPAGWLKCDGSTFSATDYPRLADFLGGTTLPNLTDRFPIGAGTKALGTSGGDPTKTIGIANMPAHNHSMTHKHNLGRSSAVGGSLDNIPWGTTSRTHLVGNAMADFTGDSGSTGSGTALDVMNPWRAVNFIIRAV